jgi:hypothetical protein
MLDAYIQHLPELLAVCFAKAQTGWNEGVTSRMRGATGELIDILQRVLVYLVGWYPPHHFDGKAADVYFSEFIANRYAWHRALNTPSVPGSGGTIAGVLAGRGALDDVLTAISDMVAALAPIQFDFKEWRERWQSAQQRPENKVPSEQPDSSRVLEIVYGEDLPECVRDTRNPLYGGTDVRRWWVGLRNSSTSKSVDEVSLRAHSNQFVECTIAVAHRPVEGWREHNPIFLKLETLPPKAEEFVELFGVAVGKRWNEGDILGKKQTFTLEARGRDVKTVRAVLEYDPTTDPPIIRRTS